MVHFLFGPNKSVMINYCIHVKLPGDMLVITSINGRVYLYTYFILYRIYIYECHIYIYMGSSSGYFTTISGVIYNPIFGGSHFPPETQAVRQRQCRFREAVDACHLGVVQRS